MKDIDYEDILLNKCLYENDKEQCTNKNNLHYYGTVCEIVSCPGTGKCPYYKNKFHLYFLK